MTNQIPKQVRNDNWCETCDMDKLRGKNYYRHAKIGSSDMEHPGMKLLYKLSKKADRILDLGCGEGTRLNFLVKEDSFGLGIDISKKAINMAKKRYSRLKFKKANLEKLPLKNESFDLVYMAFVLEHLTEPEIVINEAIRVLKRRGNLVFIAPNYGSPNRASPPFKGSRKNKFISGLLRDARGFFTAGTDSLAWSSVEPVVTNDLEFQSDFDTTIEPYLGSLIKFVESKGLKIKKHSSCWNQELDKARFVQKIFKFLGQFNIYPFNLWGPHLLLHAVK